MEETIHKNFNFREIKFSSFSMASFTVVRDLYSDKEGFLLVDIGGEVTDISMVKKNILRESISFPLGRNFMIRGAAATFNCSLHEASSCISLFKAGHATEDVNKKLDLVIGKLKKEWLVKFQDSLANLSNDISIPANIYLAVDDDFADFFSETIQTEQFSQYTLTESKFKIVFLSAKLLHGLATFTEDVTCDYSSLLIPFTLTVF